MAYLPFLALVLVLAGAALLGQEAEAQDYYPAFDPSAFKGPPSGPPNRVLVLGTPHLSNLPDDAVSDATLEPLLERLARWKPEAIATEDMSGVQCDALRRYPERYAETVKTYCWDPAAAGAALGLEVPAAQAEVERLLSRWPVRPDSAQRRHLAAMFLAAGERASALVQWLRLPQAERVAGDGLSAQMASYLATYGARRNETTRIASVLAARLGHERVWSVDDHSADTPDPPDPAEARAYGEAIEKAWENTATRQRQAARTRLEARVLQPNGLLAMVRACNSPLEAELVYRSDFGAALAEPSKQGFGRQYLAYWETRNLRMVANLREVLGRRPGTRLLAIVGASHKGYYEAYLNQMHDVQLADAEQVLR